MDVNEKKMKQSGEKANGGALKRLGERLKDKLSEKGEREVRARLRAVVTFALTVGTSYLLSVVELPFSAFPFALALACSTRKHLPAVAIGILLSSLAGVDTVYGLTCVAVIFARVLIALLPVIFSEQFRSKSATGKSIIPYKNNAVDEPRNPEDESAPINYINESLGRVFCERSYVRVLTAASAGLLCGVFLLIGSNFSFYRLCTALLLFIAAPALTLALGGVFGESEHKGSKYTYLSLAVILFFAVYGALELRVIGMPLAPCLAMLITLYACADKGIIAGCGAALLTGVAFDPTYSPLLVLSAALFCLISAVKRNAGIVAVCALSVVWCYYIGRESGLIEILPPMLLAIPLYMIADKYREMMSAPYMRGASDGLYFAAAVTEQSKNEAAGERLSALSDTFSSLSEAIYKLSHRLGRSDALGIRRITDSAFEKVCEGCKNRERCWGDELDKTLEAAKRITSRLQSSGSVVGDDLPAGFDKECIRAERLIAEVNLATRRSTEEMISGGKINFFASNYDDITAILKDALNNDSGEYECDLKAGEQMYELFCSFGISSGGVVVYGKRCVHVVAKGVRGADKLGADKMNELRRLAGELVGVELGEPVVEVGKDGSVLLMSSRARIKAACAHGRISRSGREWSSGDHEGEKIAVDPFSDGEDICGDMTNAFITDSSYFYSLVSDGMGSGSQAAYTSGVCAMFIEKMLMAGNRADVTLRMLNNVVRSENMGCGDECSATVDLLELDLMSGMASFIKSGAAPTYVAREGTVYKISSRTMPVGIIKDADARITRFDTRRGDIIVMMSDGCCHDSEDCPWLVEYLCTYMTKSKKTVTVGDELCEVLKSEILREAIKNAPEVEGRDDISVSVTVVG